MQPIAARPNTAIAAALLACAALLFVGLLTRGWVSVSRRRVEASQGLLGQKVCDDGECRGKFFDFSTRGDGDVHALRFLTFALGMVTVVYTGLVGGLALTGKRLSAVPLYVLSPLTLLVGLAFIGRVISEAHRLDPSPGGSFLISFVALVAAPILAGVGLRKPRVAAAWAGYPGAPAAAGPPGYGAAPGGYGSAPAGYGAAPAGYGAAPGGYGAAPGGYGAAPGGAPAAAPVSAASAPTANACPRCQTPTQWVAQYQRAYCGACQQYV